MKSQFLDEIKIVVEAGSGGNGCVSTRREKYVPFGGPDGGDGGKGGDVILLTSPHYNTLLHLSKKRHYKGTRGGHGKGKKKHGKDGKPCIIPIPIGTQVFIEKEKICDLIKEKEEFVVAKGGRGGKGNASLKRIDFGLCGEKGEIKEIILKLILLADVGIIGFPNSGKSTLISRISSSHPKIAPYPFTTIVPNLGVVYGEEFFSFTVADIPGIIKDAHKGKGLGNRFLRHLERTRILIHLLDGCDSSLQRFSELNNEIALYDESILKKPQIVVLNKIDTKEAQENFIKIKEIIPNIIPISAKTGENISCLIIETTKKLAQLEQIKM
ncbi:MAG: GTPase ObgE [bacterium]